jgi:hypothetical protein
MWISKDEIARLRSDLLDIGDRLSEAESFRRQDAIAAEQRIAAANKAAEIAQNNFEWARLSLNRVEQERAMLLSHLLKFPVAAVEIARQTPFDGASTGNGIPNLPGISFDDMGDEEAGKLGLYHDETGSVVSKAQ